MVSLARSFSCAVSLTLLSLLTGCVSASESTRQKAIDFVGDQAIYIAQTLNSMYSNSGQLAREDVARVVGRVVDQPESPTGAPVGEWGVAAFEREANGEWEVFIPTSVAVNSGLDTSSVDIYGCALISNSNGVWELTDALCPEWLRQWVSPSFEEVSVNAASKGDLTRLRSP
jgi:hypothetical protein